MWQPRICPSGVRIPWDTGSGHAMRTTILTLAFVLTATTVDALADTNVSGDVSGTWALTGSPYVFVGDVMVPTGQSLTVEPGVVVRQPDRYKLVVRGRLVARGTPQAPITFGGRAGASRGGGIRFIDANAENSVIAHCIVEENFADDPVVGTTEDDAGGGIFIKNSNVTVEHSDLKFNSAGFGGAIAVWGPSTYPVTIQRNRIRSNSANSINQSSWSGGGGIGLEHTSATTVVRSNVIYVNSQFSSVATTTYQGGGGIFINGGSPSVTNNTLWINHSPKGCGIHIVPDGDSAIVLANNLVWRNNDCVNPGQVTLQVDVVPGGTLSPNLLLTHNVVQGGFQKVYGNTLEANLAGVETLTADPNLYDPSSGRFELWGNSNAIDSGTSSVPGYSALDYHGLPRVDFLLRDDTGAGTPTYADRGAIEWVDQDGDSYADGIDTCPTISNGGQTDLDNDSFGDPCDCAPSDHTIYPGAPESCDAVDSDCDGSLVDITPETDTDGDTENDCVDSDDDGDGTPDATDCAPLDVTRHPGAAESCDAVDSDCDGSLVDDFPDADGDVNPDCVDDDDDGDGARDDVDCAPTDRAIHPGAAETCDGVDSDCDGMDCSDEDGAGADEPDSSCGCTGGGGLAPIALVVIGLPLVGRRRRLPAD
jgi:hypothetical protein